MKILVAAVEWFPDHKGGNGRVASSSARELVRRGHDVAVLVPYDGRGERSYWEEGVLVHRAIKRGRIPLTITDFVHSARYGRRLSRRGFDVLLAHTTMGACGLSMQLKLPLVLVYHAGVDEQRFERMRRPFGWRRASAAALAPVQALLETTAVRVADSVLVLSEFSRSLVLARHPRATDRVRRVPGGVELSRFFPLEGSRERLGIDSQELLLVTARRLEPRMGLESLIEAIARLRARHRLRLSVIGEGTLAPHLIHLVNRLELEQQVLFLGAVSDEILADWYRAADLVVIPTAGYEGLGMVTLEALACGTPVLGTAVGATPEILEPLDPRLLVIADDPQALASGIERILPALNNNFGRRCRQYVTTHFDWRTGIGRWEAAIAEAAGK